MVLKVRNWRDWRIWGWSFLMNLRLMMLEDTSFGFSCLGPDDTYLLTSHKVTCYLFN